ncbi:hypothetical protein STEG23_013239 [Scotinomys teguina]
MGQLILSRNLKMANSNGQQHRPQLQQDHRLRHGLQQNSHKIPMTRSHSRVSEKSFGSFHSSFENVFWTLVMCGDIDDWLMVDNLRCHSWQYSGSKTVQRLLYRVVMLRPPEVSLEFDLLDGEFHGKLPKSIREPGANMPQLT